MEWLGTSTRYFPCKLLNKVIERTLLTNVIDSNNDGPACPREVSGQETKGLLNVEKPTTRQLRHLCITTRSQNVSHFQQDFLDRHVFRSVHLTSKTLFNDQALSWLIGESNNPPSGKVISRANGNGRECSPSDRILSQTESSRLESYISPRNKWSVFVRIFTKAPPLRKSVRSHCIVTYIYFVWQADWMGKWPREQAEPWANAHSWLLKIGHLPTRMHVVWADAHPIKPLHFYLSTMTQNTLLVAAWIRKSTLGKQTHTDLRHVLLWLTYSWHCVPRFIPEFRQKQMTHTTKTFPPVPVAANYCARKTIIWTK